MAETTLLLNGFSILGDPQTNSNASNGGEFMVHDGDTVFEADDIVMFIVEGANPDGSLNENSVIVGIVVYDNASDYYYDTPKYTYEASPGAPIGTGRNNMGDRYLEFDASSLTSTDSGAPALGELALFGGIDIHSALANSNGPYEIPTNENIDFDGDGQISPEEEGDGVFSSQINSLTAICYCSGTLIETPDGPKPIDRLEIGDLVNTLDNGPQPIRWIGGAQMAGTGVNAPVLIKAGALGNTRDLWVSQNHRILISGAWAELLFGQNQVLVAAKHLVNDMTIRLIPQPLVEYYHFLLDSHEIVFAEACPSESLFPGKQTLNNVTDAEHDEILTLFPDLARSGTLTPTARYALKAFEAETLTRVA